MIKELCVLGFLGGNAWMDLKKRKISLAAAGLFAGIGMFLSWRQGGLGWQYLASAGVGLLFLAVSLMTRGELGMGDGFLILALGTVLSLEELLTVVMLAMAGSAVCAGVLLLGFHRSRKTQIPFVPFLLLGYMGGLLIW